MRSEAKPPASEAKPPASEGKPATSEAKPTASESKPAGRKDAGARGEGRPSRREEGLGAPGAPPLDTAWTAFRTTDAGQFTRATLTLPGGAEGVVRIRSENRNGWRDDTRIEAATGRIRVHEVGGERPLGVRIAGNMLDVHSGRIFGVLGPPVFLVAALLMPLFLITGLLLYVGRRAARARRRAAPAPGGATPALGRRA
ncbi:PepSY domain-containing protein [Methylobacterium sp. J-078]|uniref:PepSY-associated TM helix domain-containing protein n=1 Tax=Methylobacterium sp. J-078 TaxID=2836657 RepID=UPI001FBA43C7|nr:PepSY-associated TM helix domain-containing protein [Methylobacterium sp. J-078]MCJ2044926.1 PepSY domain-containing protein [Methylobacterium sp. J-078]